MNSYFYPTHPCWFDELLVDWKNSGKRTLVFPFLRFKPTTLPQDEATQFWMYLYYTEGRTKIQELKKVVQYRVRVISYSFSKIQCNDAFTHAHAGNNAKIWFECDLVEEIKKINGSYVNETDFKHSEGVSLLQAIRNSIAPVRRVSPIVTVQSTFHCVSD